MSLCFMRLSMPADDANGIPPYSGRRDLWRGFRVRDREDKCFCLKVEDERHFPFTG